VKYKNKIILKGVLFLLPALGYLIVVRAIPVANALYLSFFRPSGPLSLEFIGLDNYFYLLTDPEFLNSIRMSVYFVFGSMVPVWVLSLGLALLLSITNRRFVQTYRTIIFLPIVIEAVVASITWRFIYLPYYGLLSGLLRLVHLDTFADFPWLTNSRLAMPALIIMQIWRVIGFYMVMYIGGLQSIATEYYEAAEIDGAGTWKKFLKITFPLLTPTFLYVVVISLAWTFGWFTAMYVMTGGGPGSSTTVVPMYLFKIAFVSKELNSACAGAIIFFFVVVAITALLLLVYEKAAKAYE